MVEDGFMRTKSMEVMNAILSFINDYFIKYHCMPTQREIAVNVGMSESSIYRYLCEMDKRGLIIYEDGIIRTQISETACDYAKIAVYLPKERLMTGCGIQDWETAAERFGCDSVEDFIVMAVDEFINNHQNQKTNK